MKRYSLKFLQSRRFGFLCLAFAALMASATLRAGLTLEMNAVRYHQYGYYFAPNLSTNFSGTAAPFGDYLITSSNYPTNGAWQSYRFDTNGFAWTGGGQSGYGDFASMMQELTNGTWFIYVTTASATNTYRFGVTANLESNSLPYVNITFPANGSVNVTNRPTFEWQGPTNYNSLVVYYYNSGDVLPATQTSLLSGRVLYLGPNSVTVHYDSNSITALVSSVPTNSLGQPISSWISTAKLQDYATSQFYVGSADTTGTGHTLVAHFTWDQTNADGTASGEDVSGNGFNLNFRGSHGSGAVRSTTTAAAGARAIHFQAPDYGSAGYIGWAATPTNLLATLAGSFSVSCWIKTTQSAYSWDQGPAYEGAGIVSADVGGLANDVVPLALTGTKLGFNTGGDEDVTLNSNTSVNDGVYHHVVITRNQQSGQKLIYIDGLLDNFSSGSINFLDAPQKITIGALSNAGNPDPNDGSYYNGYDGDLDDLQIYSGVLSSNEVVQLYQNPGTTANQFIAAPLVGRYDFEQPDAPGLDSSGNGNDSNCGSGTGNTNNLDVASANAAVGSYARNFRGDTSLCFFPNGASSFLNLSNALYGDFSLTAWVKTTNTVNFDFANAYFGAPIWFEYADPANQVVFSITGQKAAFTVGNPNGASDTVLHSTTTVNDGVYHLLAATRNATTGVVKLYVDGNLEATGVSTNRPIIASAILYLAGGYNGFFTGLLDDVRIWGGEMSAAEVATLAGRSWGDFNSALGTVGLTWTTGGDAPWLIQSTNTYNGSSSAARSGSVTNFQTSTLQTTVTGPGTLTFWWSCHAEDPNFSWDLEFDIDGAHQNDIYGVTAWQQEGPFTLGPGTHALTWTASAFGDTDPAQAGYLDEVNFVPLAAQPPFLTQQPVDQTNYPGYFAALLADSTNNPAPTWQWYRVGSGAIAGATQKFYIPANSGTAVVAGSYFVAASNFIGVTYSRTAVVSFASAPLPPDWARAVSAPTGNPSTQFTTNYGIACLVDSSGNVYQAASFTGTNYFGSSSIFSSKDRFAAGLFKYDVNGPQLWARAVTNSGNGNSYPQCVTRAPGDGVYMSGVFFGTNGLGTNALVESAGASVFLTRIDPAGNVLWVRTIGGTNFMFQSYHELTSDAAGNVTISLLGQNFVNFGTTNTFVNGQAGVLAQYDANGNVRWIQKPSGWTRYLAQEAGRLYVAFLGNPTNSIGGLTNTSDRAWALAALNATNGQALWIRGIGSAQGAPNPLSQPNDVPAVSVSGTNLFLVGNGFGSNAVFGAFSVNWSAPNGQYLARYDTNGSAYLAATFGGAGITPWVSKADGTGNVYVAGDYDGYATFGNRTIGGPHLDTIGNGFASQAFLAKFDRNGSNLWVRTALSTNKLVNLRDIDLDSGGVWACGFVNESAQFGTNTAFGSFLCLGFPICFPQYLTGGYLARITETAGNLPPAVTLLNPQISGANFQCSFNSQAGFSHLVLYHTNLASGPWLTNSTIVGDGTLKTISIPLTAFGPAQQGFVRIWTQ